LQAVLARVCLPQLTALYKGFDTVQDWARVLSLGEQQRIAIARVLLALPRYAFMDEATSAVDFATEAKLYQSLAAAGITCVSVGHRDSIRAYHQRELHLLDEGAWQCRDIHAAASA
jgi:putative ATP-binding cassette transporter